MSSIVRERAHTHHLTKFIRQSIYRSGQIAIFALVLALFGIATSQPVQAATTVYEDSIPSQQTDYNKTLTIPKFDPALGTLTQVEVTLNAQLAGSVHYESLDATGSTSVVSMEGHIQVQRPNGTVLNEAQPKTARTVALAAFDQLLDYTGPSGGSLPNLIALTTDEAQVFTATTDLSLFTGPGTLTLPVKATSSVTGNGPGNLALRYVTTAAVQIQVRYTYQGTQDPAISLKKYTNGDDADQITGPLIPVGDSVTWTYVVHNTGDTRLVDLTLWDDKEGAITCPKTELDINEEMTCVHTGVAQLGQYTNTATVTGTTPLVPNVPQKTVTDSDPSHYYGIPGLSVCPTDPNGKLILPEVQYLGQGGGPYTLPAGFDTFVVKKIGPFRFENTRGVDNGGQQVYTPGNSEERVWVCSGDCNFVPTLRQVVPIGRLGPGLTISMVVIDDDDDTRVNAWLANGDRAHPYQQITNQMMTEYLSLDIPFEADWSFHAADSLGLVHMCIQATGQIKSANLVGNGVAPAQVDEIVAENAQAIFLPVVRK